MTMHNYVKQGICGEKNLDTTSTFLMSYGDVKKVWSFIQHIQNYEVDLSTISHLQIRIMQKLETSSCPQPRKHGSKLSCEKMKCKCRTILVFTKMQSVFIQLSI